MLNILVVDDSIVDQRIASGILEKCDDWQVKCADDGADALKTLENTPVDIVVTDLEMPNMNGLELVKQLRERHPGVPSVLMTARGSEDIAVEALDSGAASYVPKRRLSLDLVTTISRLASSLTEQRETSELLSLLKRHDVSFTLTNDPNHIPLVSNALKKLVHSIWNCSVTSQLQIDTAITEALNNAREHGNLQLDTFLRETDFAMYQLMATQRQTESPFCERRIEVRAIVTADEAKFVIRDDGEGFDTTATRQIAHENLAETYGRGMTLMRAFMDEVIFNEIGNEVTLILKRTEMDLRDVEASRPSVLTHPSFESVTESTYGNPD